MKKFLLSLILCNLYCSLWANNNSGQLLDSLKSESATIQKLDLNKTASVQKKLLVGGVSAAGMAGSLYILTEATNYRYSKGFRVVDDYNSYLQVDKATHAYIAYTASQFLSGMGQWAGFSENKAILLGSAGSLAYVSFKEFLDGHKASGGWSWTDMGANALGVGLFAGQELAWHEQKIQFKYSALPRQYEPSISARADHLFGTNPGERLFTDFNAQTYWLSFNINSITNLEQIPAWLNIAVGYGADGMFAAYENIEYRNGRVVFDRRDIKRFRQWYLAPDIDLTKIRTNSRLFKTTLSVLNAVKFPLPTIEYSNQKMKGHWLHF